MTGDNWSLKGKKEEIIKKYWNEQKYDDKKSIVRDYTIEEILDMYEKEIETLRQKLIEDLKRRANYSTFLGTWWLELPFNEIEAIINKRFGVDKEEKNESN